VLGRARTSIVIVVATLAISPALAAAGFGDTPPDDGGFAELETDLSGPPGPIPKGETATYRAMVTNVGTGAADAEATVGIYTYRVNGERPVQNPFRSVVQTGPGECRVELFPSSFGDYHSAVCPVAGLAPGASTEITAIAEVNESMDVHADWTQQVVTTLVDAPPQVSGSSKIKLTGLPQACAAGDFTLKAKAKGAKKMTAALVGPLNQFGKPEAGDFSKSRKLETAKGAKLKAPIDASGLQPAFWEIKLAAKYDGKPKQKTSVLFQSC
jgi:hypothetical protein